MIRIFAIDRDVQNVLMIESVVGSRECGAAIIADLYAFAFGSQDHALRILWIDQDGINHPIAGSGPLPFAAFIGGLPEATGGAGIQRVRMLRILFDQLGTAKYEWDASVAFPVLSRVHAVINAGTRSSVHVRGVRRVNHDAHHV